MTDCNFTGMLDVQQGCQLGWKKARHSLLFLTLLKGISEQRQASKYSKKNLWTYSKMVSLFTRATRVLIIRPAIFFPGAPGDLTLDRDKPLTFENTILENRDNVMHEPTSQADRTSRGFEIYDISKMRRSTWAEIKHPSIQCSHDSKTEKATENTLSKLLSLCNLGCNESIFEGGRYHMVLVIPLEEQRSVAASCYILIKVLQSGILIVPLHS